MRGLGRYYELDVECCGQPDPRTGYLVNIKRIDEAARATVVRGIARACADRPGSEPGPVLAGLIGGLDGELGGIVERAVWKLTPTYSVEVGMTGTRADRRAGERVVIRQRFDFAAAHRLHSDALSENENRSVFGRCNNPNGHGHNYQVDVAVSAAVGACAGARPGVTLDAIERVVDRVIIDPFDHTHLNLDRAEFDTRRGGVNPSVEEIARVFFGVLSPEIERLGEGAALTSVTVWETERTCATYPG
jgi:6-pyruvoyltetrahydropterin/6-carboxytetrahydropterin synthase